MKQNHLWVVEVKRDGLWKAETWTATDWREGARANARYQRSFGFEARVRKYGSLGK